MDIQSVKKEYHLVRVVDDEGEEKGEHVERLYCLR